MTPLEVETVAERLRAEIADMPNVSYSNYKQELAEYQRILNDMTVCIRELARWAVVEDQHMKPPQTD
jgi:hypothetical protein